MRHLPTRAAAVGYAGLGPGGQPSLESRPRRAAPGPDCPVSVPPTPQVPRPPGRHRRLFTGRLCTAATPPGAKPFPQGTDSRTWSRPSTRTRLGFLCSATVVTLGGADPTLPCFYDCHLCATSAPVAALPPSLSGQMQIDRATIPDPVSGPSVVSPWCVLCGVGLWKIALPKKKKKLLALSDKRRVRYRSNMGGPAPPNPPVDMC